MNKLLHTTLVLSLSISGVLAVENTVSAVNAIKHSTVNYTMKGNVETTLVK